MFLQNWLFGVGFRQHERYMFLNQSTHNGYLAVLAEVGIIGAVPLFYFVIKGIKLLAENAKERKLEISFVISYLIVCIFERYYINIGNPVSLLFVYFICQGYVDKVKYKR